MDKHQAANIVKKLQELYPNQAASNSKEFLKYFYGYLLPLNHLKAEKAVEIVMKTSKFLPSIAEFNEAYMIVINNNDENDSLNSVKCEICNSLGFLLYTKVIDEVSYEYLAYCKCDAGKQYKYESNKYKTLLIDEVFDMDWLLEERRSGNKDSRIYDLKSVRERLLNKMSI